ncbi:putative transferase CAF17 homolog, mitochondrial isoform X1 [Oryzias melastigma]|uniref:putative transferase CAF17 homolog, mitochondrial isoform X1 n=1 Tax=Oryzias melastigma TaxID=30732 RepID=UPI000CF7E939|nr:putative transferase CAF17 homolog, mitochondrial isoform X1 [Oryzias melastigma]
MGLVVFARWAFTCLGVHAGKRAGPPFTSLSAATSCLRGNNNSKKYSQSAVNNGPRRFVCCPLPHRALLKIQGNDTSPFLQGLITNDVGLLEEPERAAMYAHMLNVQGRTLYDILLYRMKEAEGLFLECDSTVQDSVLRHLKVYKIRRKVSIRSCPELSVWAVLSLPNRPYHDAGPPELSAPEKALVWAADPRTSQMGWRLVLHGETDPLDVIASCERGDPEEYQKHRYEIGLPEGVKDLPPGVALPLESNIVFMQGISFSKGCYIGQELTARTHHTGVVRKRLMPVRLSSPPKDLQEGTLLQTQGGKAAGKHRAGVGELGLSLIRTAHAKETLMLKCSDDTTVTLEASVPDWWPKDVKVI